MVKAYSYVRMSTDAQLKGDSLRRQLEKSRSFAERRGLELDEDFAPPDIGVSAFRGDNVSSGSLGAFLSAVRSNQIAPGSFLLVESLDRLSRQETLTSLQIFMEIVNSGIVLVTLADEREYQKDRVEFADLIISIAIMSRAHEESLIKSQRIKASWENKRRRIGERKLTSNGPGWLKLAPDRKTFLVIEERAEIVRRIFKEACSGIGIYKIARRLNAEEVPPFGRSNGWHQSSVSKILQNRAVFGEFQFHRKDDEGVRVPVGDPVSDYFPTIVSSNEFYSAQVGRIERLASGRGRKGENVSNLFAGLLKCAYCSSRIFFENKGSGPKGGKYLVCEAGNRKHKCEGDRWRYDDFETSFLTFVEELKLNTLLAPDDAEDERTRIKSKLDATRMQLLKLESRRDKTYELIDVDSADVQYLKNKLQECSTGIEAAKSQIADLETELAKFDRLTKTHHDSSETIQDVIAQMRSGGEQDVYKQRSLIRSRLGDIVDEIQVSIIGYEVMGRKIAAELKTNMEWGPEIRAEFESLLNNYHSKPESRMPHFEVTFKNGSTRTVLVDGNNPRAVRGQSVGDGNQLEMIYSDGRRKLISD